MPYDMHPCSLISRMFEILPYPMSENERFMHCFAQAGSV
jgi:hypothetical protein